MLTPEQIAEFESRAAKGEKPRLMDKVPGTPCLVSRGWVVGNEEPFASREAAWLYYEHLLREVTRPMHAAKHMRLLMPRTYSDGIGLPAGTVLRISDDQSKAMHGGIIVLDDPSDKRVSYHVPVIECSPVDGYYDAELDRLRARVGELEELVGAFADWDNRHPKGMVHDFKAERELDALFDRAKGGKP